MRLITKIILNLLIAILIMSVAFSLYANADDDRYNADSFTGEAGSEKAQEITTKAAGSIIVIVRAATSAIAVVMLLIIAARYMISAPGERADIKKHAIPYVIGAIILFGASGILTIIGNLSDNINPQG